MDHLKYTYMYVHHLIKHGIIKDINTELHSTDKLPLLHIATLNRDERLVDYLLHKGADTNLNILGSGTPLHLAVEVESLEITKRLLNFGANVNAQSLGDPCIIPLHNAILQNNTKIAEFLIKNGADVNFVMENDSYGYRGRSMLNMAIYKRHKEIVELLLKNNADPNIAIPVYRPALIIAFATANVAIIKLLLAHGADINGVPVGKFDFFTPLNIAVIKQELEPLDLLLNNNMININPVKRLSIPTLHIGVSYVKKCCVIQRVLDAGVDVNLETNGQTALGTVIIQHPNSARPLVRHTIKKHIVKLRAANIYVSKKNLAAVDSEDFNDLYNQCNVEIGKMKTTNICSSNLTFYHVLHYSRHELASRLKYVSDEIILHFDTETLFPQYAGMINYRLKMALERKKLLLNVTDLIYDIFDEIGLPNTFSRKIFEFLTYEDLTKLIPY